MTRKLTDAIVNQLMERVKKAPNYLTLIVRGHFVIELILDQAIQRFSHAESAELKRIPFAIKIELATALGVIPKDSRPLFRIFNALRNKIAHDPFSRFGKKQARDLVNCISNLQRQIIRLDGKYEIENLKNREFLWRCALAMYVQIHSRIRHKIHEQTYMKMTMEEIGPFIAKMTERKDSNLREEAFDAKVDVAAKKVPTIG